MGVTNLVSGLNIKLIVSQELIDGINWFFACCYDFIQIKRWLKSFGVSMVKNGCDQYGDGTLKLTVSEEWTDGIWFFASWYIIAKLKADQNFCGWAFVKNESGQSGHGTLKLTVSQKWTFHVGSNSGKLKVDSVIFGWVEMAMAF